MAVMTYSVTDEQGWEGSAEQIQQGAARLSTWVVSFLVLPWYMELLTVVMTGRTNLFGGRAAQFMDIAGGLFFPIALIWVMVAACRPMPKSRKTYMIIALAGAFAARVVASTLFAG